MCTLQPAQGVNGLTPCARYSVPFQESSSTLWPAKGVNGLHNVQTDPFRKGPLQHSNEITCTLQPAKGVNGPDPFRKGFSVSRCSSRPVYGL
jgi:hypothetical protein